MTCPPSGQPTPARPTHARRMRAGQSSVASAFFFALACHALLSPCGLPLPPRPAVCRPCRPCQGTPRGAQSGCGVWASVSAQHVLALRVTNRPTEAWCRGGQGAGGGRAAGGRREGGGYHSIRPVRHHPSCRDVAHLQPLHRMASGACMASAWSTCLYAGTSLCAGTSLNAATCPCAATLP